MTKVRACASCGKSITRRHGNARYCKDCSRLVDNKTSREWWARNNYSQVVAERRTKAKQGLDRA